MQRLCLAVASLTVTLSIGTCFADDETGFRPIFDGQSLTGSLLIPVQLAAEVGDREVQSLDGTPLNEVPVEG